MIMSRTAVRWTLIGLEVFTFVMALYGSISMLVDAVGFGLKDEWLQGSPFATYQVPAFGLLIGVGGSSFIAAISVWRAQGQLGGLLSMIAGGVLVVFEIVEEYAIGLRNVQQPLMFIIGLLMVGLGAVLWWREQQPSSPSAARQRSA
jgi:hypothetical protein